MTKSELKREVLQLPAQERHELAEALWESLEREARQPEIPQWQRDLLDERIAGDEANPEAGSPWDEVKRRILSSL
jgi:putative addiction module component (TIGR02574 family)